MFDLNSFISEHVTKRNESLFLSDIESNREALFQRISEKSLLVIGGAGSIGSSFIKAVLPFRPRSLVVVDTNENALAELTRDLRSSSNVHIPSDYVTYPMDYASPVFAKLFRARCGFDIVANFSAHKHVRSEKDLYSIEALLRNNVIQARSLLNLLEEYPPETYFCVSTDKAANPVSIMGASKRIMEDMIFSYSDVFPVKTARFANVAFSNGSLPAGFLERIRKRQPLSAPSDIKRYFVSPEESGQICMLACFLGNNREIFFPKLAEEQMMSFDTIALKLLDAYGYSPVYCPSDQEAIALAASLSREDQRYPVHFSVSDTSGEKPFEEFFTDSETIDITRFSSLGVIVDKEFTSRKEVEQLCKSLSQLFENSDCSKEQIVNLLQEYLPCFNHIESGKSLDMKM